LYLGIVRIYDQNKANESSLTLILPIIGFSMRLLLDIAAKEYFTSIGDSKKANEDDAYRSFLDEVKKKLRVSGKQGELNYAALTTDWLDVKYPVDAILGKWAHGTMVANKSEILKMSQFVGDILELYFKRK
jgi:hypothetical protein